MLAALLGCLFVLPRADFRTFVRALFINLCFALADFACSAAALFLPGLLAIAGLLLLPAMLAAIQSSIIVRTVRSHFVRQGWIVTQF